MPTGQRETETTESDELAPRVFVREVDADSWEVVERATDERIGETYASRNEALDAALAELGNPVKPAVLKGDDGAVVGAWRWLDATSEEPESAALDENGELVRPRITAAAIESMAAQLNASPMPRPIDGGAVPADMLPSEPHGTRYDSGTPANGWAHAGVPFVTAKGETHLALRGELWPTVAREFDRGRIAYGSVHVEADAVDETGAMENATLESHALTNRPVVQTLVPSTAMLSRSRRAVITLRGKGTMGTKKVITLRGPALDAITKVCAELGVSLEEELDASDSWASIFVERYRALKQLAIGEQVLESLPAGSGDAAAAALSKAVKVARTKHLKRVALSLAEGETAATDDAATKAVAALQKALGVSTPEEVLAWIEEHADDLAAMASGEGDDADAGEGTTATKSKGKGLTLKLALSKIERLEARLGKYEDDEVARLVEADIAAGKIATAEREEYLELARTNRDLYVKLTKNARAVPTGRVTTQGETRQKGAAGGKHAHAELGLGPLTESEDAKVRAMKAARVSKAGIVRAIERVRAEG